MGSIGLQVIEAGAGFATSLVLARALGAAEFGAYAFGIALAGFLTIPALLGHNTLAIREVASLAALLDWPGLRTFLVRARRRVLLSSVLVTFAGLMLLALFGTRLAPSVQNAALASMTLVPVLAVLRLYEGYLKGIGRVVVAQFPDKAFRPILFLLLALGAHVVFGGLGLGSEAVYLNFLATCMGLVLLLILWCRLRPGEIARASKHTEGSIGYRQALPFALMAGVSVINTQADLIMLGVLSTPEDVGIYRIASRVATLVAFALTAVVASLGPRISMLYATGNHREIQNLATKAAFATTIVALPMAAVLIVEGHWVLLLFGRDFQAGTFVLSVLSIGQLINAAMGVVVILLTMTGHERIVAKTLTISALLNIALNVAFIPRFGAAGAATATTITYFVWNLSLALIVFRVLRIDPTIIGAITWWMRKHK